MKLANVKRAGFLAEALKDLDEALIEPMKRAEAAGGYERRGMLISIEDIGRSGS